MSLPPKLFITSIMIPTVITVLSAVLFQLAAGGAVQKRAAAVNYDLNDLPKSNVHYLWDSTLDDATAIKKCMTLAMKQISDVSCVKFVNTNDNNPPRDSGFIVFSLNIKDKACHSFIRLTHGIGTQVSMGRKCGVVLEVCLHEIMHALGFVHEHQRKEHEKHVHHNYVNDEKNVIPDVQNLTPYDISSIMHYGAKEFALSESKMKYYANDKLLEYSLGSQIRGSHKALSFRDQLAINKLFRCSESCEKKGINIKCEHGGFLQANCTCKCTYGFTGTNCSKFSFAKWFNIEQCGEVVVPKSRSGYITSPNYPSRYPRGVFCQWLIKSENDYDRIEFRIESLDLEFEDDMNLNQRCQDKLFIWPHGTDVTVQFLNCHPNDVPAYVGEKHVTQYNWLLVEFRSDKWGQNNHTGFNISYKIVDPRPKVVKVESSSANSELRRNIPDFAKEIPVDGLTCFGCEGRGCDGQSYNQVQCKSQEACARRVDPFGRIVWRGCKSGTECALEMNSCKDSQFYGCHECCVKYQCNNGLALIPHFIIILCSLLLFCRFHNL